MAGDPGRELIAVYPEAFEYDAPGSVEEAVEILADDADARPLAGGQSLLPLMKLRLASPARLVDLRRLDDLRYVRETEEGIEVGALTPHARVASSSLLRERAPALAEAAAAVGDMQVRNRGTIGGSLSHADPAADLPAAAVALDASLRVRGPEGEREIPAEDFFPGSFTTALRPGELLTAMRFAAPDGARGAYEKLTQKASGFALVGAAAVLELDGGTCRRARIGLTGVGARPLRVPEAEEALQGAELDEEAVAAACDGVGAGLRDVQGDVHATADYRRAMAEVYARRAVARAAS